MLLLIFAGVVGQSVLAADGDMRVLITDPILKEHFGKQFKKPYGKFAPPMYLTEADLGKVTSLNLSDTKITDEGLKEVAKLQQIELLYLERTQITDAGLMEVAKLQKLSGLDLTGTKTTDAGLAEVVIALPECVISY